MASVFVSPIGSGGRRLGKEVLEEAAERGAGQGDTTLYRAVSDDELADIAEHGFRPGRGSMETKLFATSVDDAAQFGRGNYGFDGKPFTLLEIRVPNPVANMLYRGSADSMPLRGLDPSHLETFNRAARVRKLNSIPTGR